MSASGVGMASSVQVAKTPRCGRLAPATKLLGSGTGIEIRDWLWLLEGSLSLLRLQGGREEQEWA